MSHLKLKTILVYSSVIATVLALFQGINLLGTNKLKAPPKMTGIYTLNLLEYSECFPTPIKLDLQQSGIYFFANLNLNNSSHEKITENSLKINGKLKNQEDLLLLGKIQENSTCFNKGNPLILTIKPLLKKDEISGYLMVNEKKFNFQGKLQSEVSQTESKH